MDWKDIASVDLPAGAQTGDYLALVDQLEQQVKTALAPKSEAPDAPHTKALAFVVEDAFNDLVTARDNLRTSESKRAPVLPVGTTADQSETNLNADETWRGLEGFVGACRHLVDEVEPGSEDAEILHQRLFAKHGLRFINYRPRRQWEVASGLVKILDEPEVTQVIEDLGGARFLKGVHRWHREYGLAYGFTQSTPHSAEEVTNTRDEQLALQIALRDYVLKVSAQVSPRRPDTAELARFLLQPFLAMVEDLERRPRPVRKSLLPHPPA